MRIALVGNHNAGKTTLFNHLTGSNQKVGNWPGVTLEKKTGILRSTDHEIVDLPGIYSLSPYGIEEKISQAFLLEGGVDLIINIIDSTTLERSLYLTTQLLELDIPVMIALNMSDIAVSRGIDIDLETLEQKLDATIIAISALKKTGIYDLIQAIKNGLYRQNRHERFYDHAIEKALKDIETHLDVPHRRHVAIGLIEGNLQFNDKRQPVIDDIIENLSASYQRDMEQIIADERYRTIEMMRDQAITVRHQRQSWTDTLDKIFLNRILAIPLFFIIMFGIYYLAAGPFGAWTVELVGGWMEVLSETVEKALIDLGASAWSVSLVVNGILAGVGAIMAFLPQLVMLFVMIALLESTGYMSRIAFVLDRLFQRVGLSGKSLIPFIIGSGCSVPAILASRAIHDEREKKMTVMLTPFVPCSAKLPIIVLFAGYFFTNHSGLAAASLYFLAIFVIFFSALLLNKLFFKGRSSSYISELPQYKWPNISYVLRDVYGKAKAFIKHAGSIILMASVVVWFLISFSWRLQYGINPDQSMLAGIGHVMAWLFYPMLGTWNWGATVSALQGLVAKEQVVSSMAIIAGFSEETSEGMLIFGSSAFAFFTPASAYAFMVFNLFSAPCFGAIGAMRQELGTNRRMLLAVLYQTGLAWVLAVIVFNIGRLIEAII